MRQQRGQDALTRERRRWLSIALSLGMGMAVAYGVAPGSQAAAARECHRETPMPADVRLSAPAPEVPEVIARFAGAWIGEWEQSGGLCHTLVVEEVLAHGDARVIYSVGTSVDLNIRLPGYWRASGSIANGELRFHLPVRDRPELTYQFAGETLSGTFKGEGRVKLTRVADLTQVGCGTKAGGLPPALPAAGPRDRLTAPELLASPEAVIGPVHNTYYMPIGRVEPARHVFKGILTVPASTMFRARHGCAGLAELLPGFEVAFFTHEEHLVPVARDILQPPGIILSPGRVWSEPGDEGLSRASFPFVLTDPHVNEAHHGLATFLYDNSRVSALRMQVVQESAPPWNKYDGWAQISVAYTPGSIPNEQARRAQFADELQHQTPIRPWSALPVSPWPSWLDAFDGGTPPADLKASGLIIDGVIYLRGCETRAGPYPYCREMRHGVYSVTKSLGAAVALLRLAQQYGDQVFDLKIKDYVAVTAPHDGWERVTFKDALNMATGVGESWPQRELLRPFGDEEQPKFGVWLRVGTAQQKLALAFSYDKYPWGPGEVLRYSSINTFVLAAAMDSFLKRQAGPNAHLWDMVVAEVFRPIGIFHLPTRHTQEADGTPGIPPLGYGLYPNVDDIAKLTTLLHNGGRHQGQQLLSAAKVAEALYKTETRGLPSGRANQFGDGRYHLSLWSEPYRTANGCFFQIPYMAGWGGNLVVLLPNSTSAFRFTDGYTGDIDVMVWAGEAIRPFTCPSGPGEAPPGGR
jgi:Beta-lactamase